MAERHYLDAFDVDVKANPKMFFLKFKDSIVDVIAKSVFNFEPPPEGLKNFQIGKVKLTV